MNMWRNITYTILFGVLFVLTTPDTHAALSLTNGDNATTTPNVATSITGFQIVGPDADTTPVKLFTTSGTLTLGTTTGLTFTGDQSGSVIYFSGTVANINAALATLRYERSTVGSDTLEVSLVSPGEVFFTENDHLYKFIAGSYTWSAARTAAQSQEAYGATGYLATITSAAENTFISARLTGDGWIAATDAAVEGTWRWADGPEDGVAFWQGTGGGNTVGGNYANWNSGEPNQSGEEDCAQTYVATGRWNDLNCGNSLGYVLEFGEDGNMPEVVAANISITTADVPAVSTLSPANAATEVLPTANLEISFTKTVTAQSGSVLIKKVSDDSTIATIDITDDQVSGSGTDTITIDPTTSLPEGEEVYVVIPNTVLQDGSGNYFDGITNTTTWRFTVADVTAPILSSISSGTPLATSTTVTWNTNEAASTKVSYGLTGTYGTSTPITNTSPRVSSHSVSLQNLLSCTTYHYAAISGDASGNIATSTDSTFITAGCQYSTTPTAATSTAITASTGGTTNVTENGKQFSVTAPANATATSSSFVIQVKAVPSTSVLGTIGRPTSAPNEVGVTVFDVTAIVNGDTVLDSFDAEVTITYEYSEEEIASLEESSLWLYHYSGGQWSALNNCVLNTSGNTISCTTPSFSIFGLFGETEERGGVSGGVRFGCRDESATNYDYFSAHRQELCIYKTEASPVADITRLLQQYSPLFMQAHQAGIILPAYILETLSLETNIDTSDTVRDLEYGMEGDDVTKLQNILISEGFAIPAGATGYFGLQTEYALDAYQVQHGILPRGGYFGPITRAQMKERGIVGVWW